MKKLRTSAIAAALLVTSTASAIAQGTCDPAKLAAAVDRYAAEPFSARSWRVIKGLGDPGVDPVGGGSDNWDAREGWKKLVAGVAPGVAGVQEPDYNCRVGYPLEVLKSRVATLGKEHPYIQQWLRAQEAVFQACGGSQAIAGLPDPLELTSKDAKMQADDRAYQEASIAFYRDKQLAIQQFRRIAQSDSPHRASARYNVANLLANAKQPAEARTEAQAILADPTASSVHTITKELLGYIANLEDAAPGWTSLINESVAAIETPLAEIKNSPAKSADYARALYDIDYVGIRTKDDDFWLEGKLPENPTVSKAIVDTARTHPIVPWMIAGQTTHSRSKTVSWQYQTESWRAKAKDYLMRSSGLAGAGKLPPVAEAALMSLAAGTDDASRAGLWKQANDAAKRAAESCGEAPETASAGLLLQQAVRTSAAAGKVDEAIAELKASPLKTTATFSQDSIWPLAQNLLGQGNLADARKLRDLITPDAVKVLNAAGNSTLANNYAMFLSWLAEDDQAWRTALGLHSAKTELAVMNLQPASKLWAFAEDQGFSAEERALFARAAWTRDYALGRKADEAKTKLMLGLNPAIADAWAKTAADYPKTAPARQQLVAILRSPRLNMLVNSPGEWGSTSMSNMEQAGIDSFDHNDRNWWCPLETDRHLEALRAEFDNLTGDALPEYGMTGTKTWLDTTQVPDLKAARDAVLKDNPAVTAIDWKEVANLAKVPSAPAALSRLAIRWAKRRNPEDGAAEALAQAVKTTRYGCNWHGGHGSYSKEAQKLLQAKFKETTWAKATPYWFDCQRNIWDKDYNKVVTCDAKTWEKQAIPK